MTYNPSVSTLPETDSSRWVTRLTVLARTLGGAATVGLLAVSFLPDVLGTAIAGAAIGLVGGYFSKYLDRGPDRKAE